MVFRDENQFYANSTKNAVRGGCEAASFTNNTDDCSAGSTRSSGSGASNMGAKARNRAKGFISESVFHKMV